MLSRKIIKSRSVPKNLQVHHATLCNNITNTYKLPTREDVEKSSSKMSHLEFRIIPNQSNLLSRLNRKKDPWSRARGSSTKTRNRRSCAVASENPTGHLAGIGIPGPQNPDFAEGQLLAEGRISGGSKVVGQRPLGKLVWKTSENLNLTTVRSHRLAGNANPF